MMISEVNTQALLRCIRNNEDAPGFWFAALLHWCESYGCLIGNDALQECEDTRRMIAADGNRCVAGKNAWDWAVNEYRLPISIFKWLFHTGNGVGDTKEQRLNRLRKAAYYFAHKKEMLLDDSGRIRETARRAEGDHFVLREVKQAVERKDRELVTA